MIMTFLAVLLYSFVQQFHQSTKKTTTYDIGIQFLVFERYNKCGGVNGILSLPS
jgi:hypothetical protein